MTNSISQKLKYFNDYVLKHVDFDNESAYLFAVDRGYQRYLLDELVTNSGDLTLNELINLMGNIQITKPIWNKGLYVLVGYNATEVAFSLKNAGIFNTFDFICFPHNDISFDFGPISAIGETSYQFGILGDDIGSIASISIGHFNKTYPALISFFNRVVELCNENEDLRIQVKDILGGQFDLDSYSKNFYKITSVFSLLSNDFTLKDRYNNFLSLATNSIKSYPLQHPTNKTHVIFHNDLYIDISFYLEKPERREYWPEMYDIITNLYR